MENAEMVQERWNDEAVEAALAEFGEISDADLAAAGFHSGNAPLSFEWRGRVRHSALPYAGGAVRPAVARVLDALHGELGPRASLLWLTGSCGYLEGRRPVDLLKSEPDEVVRAARHQIGLSRD
jgi:hypothetical protein